jgi:hypothetical protein
LIRSIFMETRKLEARFESLVLKILKVQFPNTERNTDNYDADFNVYHEKGKIFVESKIVRSSQIDTTLLVRICNQLVERHKLSQNNSTESSFLILIVTTNVTSLQKQQIHKELGISIWDREVLFYLASYSLELTVEFEKFFQDISLKDYKPASIDKSINKEEIEKKVLSGHIPSRVETNQLKGASIINRIQNLPVGKGHYRDFESLGIEALKYVFSDDLDGWSAQHRTRDSLHRYDVICTFKSSHEYWKFLMTHFKSRFVVLEFKNFAGKITQKEIYSTEKYLYSTALRTVAFIFSRKGAKANAQIAMDGALREHGKLIMHFDQNELIELIELRDKNDVIADRIIEKIDSMLIKLSR